MIALSPTDVLDCEACWNAPVTAARQTPAGRDLLCEECAGATTRAASTSSRRSASTA